ncbi:hypothetical protein [Nocardia australiensis]|uniref:hypothetical protein n=1 Tax=Nocardia australiensis TaxID=2887191 RepID=UPI001D14BCCD|nr:hypothetical protein [Nocardia australiensis]
MALIEIDDLPTATAEVFRRRAHTAGMAPAAYLRLELIERARRRAPVDAVVEFVAANAPDRMTVADTDAVTFLDDLPVDVIAVFVRRAAAEGLPVAEYIRRDLTALARRTGIDDVMAEFREARERDPSLNIDMEAVAAAARYVRGA